MSRTTMRQNSAAKSSLDKVSTLDLWNRLYEELSTLSAQ